MKKNTKIVSLVSSFGALLLPAIAGAQSTPNFQYLDSWFNKAQSYLNISITVVMILMTLFFLINIFRLISNKDATKAKDLKQNVYNGLLGLFLAVAVWGIINLAANILGVQTGNGAAHTVDLTCPPGFVYSSISGTCVH